MSVLNKTWSVNDLCFDGNGKIPVIAQDYESGEVLLLAYMNEEALKKTIESGLIKGKIVKKPQKT